MNDRNKITPKKIAAILIPLLVIVGIVTASLLTDKSPKEIVDLARPEKKQPPAIKSPYTGLNVSKEASERRPMAVIIENSPKARPQSGLSKAEWVFEVVAEGGVTRMMAFFQSSETERLGPIRSVREYFASIAKSVDAVLIHAGGSPSGYRSLKDLLVTHVDEIKEGKPFYRSKNRKAPHNLYSSSKSLCDYIKSKGYEQEPVLPGYSFKNLKPNSKPEVKEVTINYSSAPYKVVFSHDAKSGLYKRALAGSPAIDAENNEQIAVSNVVVLVADIASTNDDKGRLEVQTEGSGALLFFSGGTVTRGQWIRPDILSPFRLVADNGEQIKLSKGKTWFSIIPSEQRVGYQVLTLPNGPNSEPTPDESGI